MATVEPPATSPQPLATNIPTTQPANTPVPTDTPAPTATPKVEPTGTPAEQKASLNGNTLTVGGQNYELLLSPEKGYQKYYDQNARGYIVLAGEVVVSEKGGNLYNAQGQLVGVKYDGNTQRISNVTSGGYRIIDASGKEVAILLPPAKPVTAEPTKQVVQQPTAINTPVPTDAPRPTQMPVETQKPLPTQTPMVKVERLPGTPGNLPDGSYPMGGDGILWSTPFMSNNICSALKDKYWFPPLYIKYDPKKTLPWGEVRYICVWNTQANSWESASKIIYEPKQNK
jgi:hypothetical protein